MDEPQDTGGGGGCDTIKGGLKRVLRCCEREVQRRITDAACRVSDLATRATLLLKLYVLDCFETGRRPVPKLTHDLVRHALKVVGGQQVEQLHPASKDKKPRRRNKEAEKQRLALSDFYDRYFDALRPDGDVVPSYTYLGDALGYTALELVTNVEVNIKQHYVDSVTAYVATACDTEPAFTQPCVPAGDAWARKRLLDKVVYDLLNVGGEPLKAPEPLHAWVQAHRKVVLPDKEDFREKLVAYDLTCTPQDYLLPMLRMAAYQEERALGGRLHHVLPLHTSAVPMHITLDTKTLVQMFFDLVPNEQRSTERVFDGVFDTLEKEANKTNKSDLRASLGKEGRKDAIWSALFRTNRRRFRDTEDYVFDYVVKTDGVSCCIVHMKRDRAAHRAARKRKRADERRRARQQHNAYIDDEGIDRAAYAGRRVVGIDPNMGNLLYASTEDGAAQFRYTQSQRRAELKIDKHAKIAQELKEGVVEGQSVAAWESQLSAHNFKTVSYDDFCRCVRTKLRVAAKVAPLYRDRWFRKNRLNAYFDRGTSERAMVSGLKRTFGAPDTVVLGIGDWAQKRHQAADQGEGLPRSSPPCRLSGVPRRRVPHELAVLKVPGGRRPVQALQDRV